MYLQRKKNFISNLFSPYTTFMQFPTTNIECRISTENNKTADCNIWVCFEKYVNKENNVFKDGIGV